MQRKVLPRTLSEPNDLFQFGSLYGKLYQEIHFTSSDSASVFRIEGVSVNTGTCWRCKAKLCVESESFENR